MVEILFNGIKISTSFKNEEQKKAFEKYCKDFTKGCSFSDGVKLKLYALYALIKDGTYGLQEGLDKIKDDLSQVRELENRTFDIVLKNVSSEVDRELAELYEKHYYDIKEKNQSKGNYSNQITVLIDWKNLKSSIKSKFGIKIKNPFVSGKRINVLEGFIILKREVYEALIKKFLFSLFPIKPITFTPEDIDLIINEILKNYNIEIKNWQISSQDNNPEEIIEKATNVLLSKLGYW